MYLLLTLVLFVFSCFMQGIFTWTLPIVFLGFQYSVKNKAEYMVEESEFDQLILMLSPIIGWIFLLLGLAVNESLSFFESIGLGISLGIVFINFPLVSSHEFYHSPSLAKKYVGVFSLLSIAFPELFLYHTYIHHKHVGTNNDPATPYYGESFYDYFLRSFVDNFKIMLKSEHKVLFVFFMILKFLVFLLVLSLFGFDGLMFYLVSLIVVRTVMALFNYIQHYGLKRNEEGNPYIWDNYDFMSNKVVFNSGMHSYHHSNPTVSFYELRRHRNSIQMPYNYTFMMTIALIPSLWFSKINPLIKDRPNILKRP